MKICSDDHDEIVYDQNQCPCCWLLKKISDLDDKVFDLKERADEIECDVESLESQLEAEREAKV